MTFCTSGSLSLSPASAPWALIAASAGAKGEQDAALQASPAGERGKAFSQRLKDKGGDARLRQARQFRQSLREQSPFSAKQRTQQQGRREGAGGAQRARKLDPLVGTA